MHIALPSCLYLVTSNLRHLWPFVLIFLLAACQNTDPTGEAPPPRVPTTGLRPVAPSLNDNFQVGDVLELLVEEDATFSSTYQVREGGYILIPKVGRIPVNGLSRATAEATIKEKLQQGQLKEATVFVERQARQPNSTSANTGITANPRLMVYLTGGVSRPGQHYIPLSPNGNTPGVYETLLVTGGFSKFGDVSKVKIMRLDANGVRRQLTANVRRISEGDIPDVPIGDGDIINVPEKVFGF